MGICHFIHCFFSIDIILTRIKIMVNFFRLFGSHGDIKVKKHKEKKRVLAKKTAGFVENPKTHLSANLGFFAHQKKKGSKNRESFFLFLHVPTKMRLTILFSVCLFFFLGSCRPDSRRVVNVGMKHQTLPHLRHSTFSPGLRAEIDRAQDQEPNDNRMDGNILPVGIYWMSVYVGTPPQHFSAAVDSGSGDLIIPSKDCVGCHPENTGEYDPTASTTSQAIPCDQSKVKCHNCTNSVCTFSNTYQTCNLTDPEDPCTVTGPLYYDTFMMGGLPGKSPFGAINYQTSNFQQFFVIDAVVGFIPHLSSWGGQSLFQTLADDGEVDNIFAMCMNASNGGVITLGGVDDSLRVDDFQITPIIGNLGYYAIRLVDLVVGTTHVGTGPFTSNTIVDSGTNVLLQRTSNFNRITNEIISQMCTPPNVFDGPGVCDNGNNFFNQTCYPYTPAQRAAFPSVSLIVDSATLTMQGPDYVVPNGTTGFFCYGIKDTGEVGLDIIGDVVMQNYYVSFDNDNHQLGWAPVDHAQCNALHSSLTSESQTFSKEVIRDLEDHF